MDPVLSCNGATFLEFIGRRKVAGNGAEGSMLLSDIKGLSSGFVNPPAHEYLMGNEVKKTKKEKA